MNVTSSHTISWAVAYFVHLISSYSFKHVSFYFFVIIIKAPRKSITWLEFQFFSSSVYKILSLLKGFWKSSVAIQLIKSNSQIFQVDFALNQWWQVRMFVWKNVWLQTFWVPLFGYLFLKSKATLGIGSSFLTSFVALLVTDLEQWIPMFGENSANEKKIVRKTVRKKTWSLDFQRNTSFEKLASKPKKNLFIILLSLISFQKITFTGASESFSFNSSFFNNKYFLTSSTNE